MRNEGKVSAETAFLGGTTLGGRSLEVQVQQ